MFYKQTIDDFLKSINKNSPLKDGYFYPYKPALIIAIFINLPTNKIFNYPININNPDILKTYYNLLTSDVNLFEKLSQQKSKQDLNISLGFNDKLSKLLLKNIFDMPAIKIKSTNNFWQVNKKEFTITINLKADWQQLETCKNLILNSAYKTFKKCVPTYTWFDDIKFDDLDKVIENQIYKQVEQKYTLMNIDEHQYQHTFIKKVKDRDKKCLICCEQQPDLLQVARIKSSNDCIDAIEKYNVDNGITLCANHHILFDKHHFTFNEDWTIRFAKSFQTTEYYLKLKEFETCYEMINLSKTTKINDFLKYRNENYPI